MKEFFESLAALNINEMSQEKKAEIVKEALQAAGKILGVTFYLLKLKTHIDGTMTFDGSGDYFEITFRKVNKPTT